MPPLNRLPLIAGALAIFAGAFAAPVKFPDIPRDSVWFGHLDCERLASGKLAPTLAARLREKDPQFSARFDELKARTGIDISKDLLGVTLYGDGTERNVTMLIYQTAPVAKIRELLRKEKAGGEEVVDGVAVFALGKKGETESGYMSVRDAGPIVFAETPASVVASVRALGGKGVAPSAEWSSTVAGRKPFWVMSARLDRFPRDKVRSVRLKDAQSASLAVSESGTGIFVGVNLTMTDDDAARKALAMANAFKGLATTAISDGKDLAVVNGLTVANEGSRLSVGLPVATGDVLRLVDKVSVQIETAIRADGSPDSGDKPEDVKNPEPSAKPVENQPAAKEAE